jgi:hypothetical protein
MDEELLDILREMREHYRRLMDPDRGVYRRRAPGLRNPLEERFRRWYTALDEAIKTVECETVANVS